MLGSFLSHDQQYIRRGTWQLNRMGMFIGFSTLNGILFISVFFLLSLPFFLFLVIFSSRLPPLRLPDRFSVNHTHPHCFLFI